MKYAIVLFLLALSPLASATTYYLSAGGNDSSNGLSESTSWKTISKLNSSFSIINPGDRILFKRGDTFYGTIKIAESGISGSPIFFGAYGTGDKPVITGFTTLSSWTNYGSGIYSVPVSCESSPNVLTINDIQYPMGRYPNTGYLTYESHVTNISITDNELSSSPNWAGGEAVIRKLNYVIDRCRITSHSGTTLSYTSLGTSIEPTDKFGYFIQNHLKTLDTFGEWYYDGSRLYLYFGSEIPSSHEVKVSSLKNLVYSSTWDYLIFDNLSFQGSASSAVYLYGADYSSIKSCIVDFSGENGIYAVGNAFLTIDDCVVENSLRAGIYIQGGKNATVTNNDISNSGMIPGGSNSSTQNDGIYATSNDDCLIQYNNISSSGYNGVYFTGNRASVKNNLINYSCMLLNDGGGIYTVGSTFTGRMIEGNIILNSTGNTEGTSRPYLYSEGIFVDSNASDVTVKNNTTANCKRSGIFFHEAHDNICTGNTSFNNVNQIRFQSDRVISYVKNISVRENIFIAKTSSQLALWARSSYEDIPEFVVADYNYYARPVDDDDVFYTQTPSTGAKYRNLEGWQSYVIQDANSKKSPVTVLNSDDIRFEYNAAKTNRVVALDKPMIDIKGNKYSGNITLLPYTSVVLFVDPNPAVVPVYKSSAVENAAPSVLEMIYDVSLANIVPPTSAFSVKINTITRSVSSVAVSGTKVLLTLAGPVVYGDVITVSYTRPATNPLQSTSGGLASSISAQVVTNKISGTPPVYINSVIPVHPTIMVMNYSLALANIVPATSSFTVKVNSVTRNVQMVRIYGSAVWVYLETGVASGDIVTVSYTKPAINPLQSEAGVTAASISDQPVTNNIVPEGEPPVYLSSIIPTHPTLMVMNYSLALANIVPATSSFTVKVNSVTRNVQMVRIYGSAVWVYLETGVASGDIVTVSYTKPAINPLQSEAGVSAASIADQTVTNNILPAGIPPVYLSSIIPTYPTIMVMNYSLTLANIVPATSSFTVKVNSVARNIQTVRIYGSAVWIYLESGVAAGDIVTVAYTKPATNPLQSEAGVTAASFSDQPVTNNILPAGDPPVYLSSIIPTYPTIMVMNYSLTLANIVPATSSFTVKVNSLARNIQSVRIYGSAVWVYLETGVTAGDIVTVAYTRPSVNPLQSEAGIAAASLTAQPVTNNIIASKSAKSLEVSEVIYESEALSGFVYEINVSDFLLKGNDLMQFDWTVPAGLKVPSTNGSGIRYLAPVVSTPEIIEFTVSISDGTSKLVKKVPVSILPYKPEFEKVKIARTAASGYNPNSYPDNATDGNISTRWSAEGNGQWIWFKLASPARINHIQLAFQPDQKYVSYFDIYGSKDNSTWEPVLINVSSCDFSGNLQVFDFPSDKITTEYSYLKIIGNGNPINKQNNLSEIRIFGKTSENVMNPSPEKVSFYPNPVRDFLNIEFSETTDELQSLKIFDLSGKLCLLKRLEPGVQTLNIPLDLSPGVYLMKVVSGNIPVFNKKFIVVR